MDKKPLKINMPYWGAGVKYKWIPEFSSPGIGIAHSHFPGNEILRIETRGETYEIERSFAVDLIKRFNSVEFHKGNKIGVIPLDAFTKLYPHPQPLDKPSDRNIM